MNQSCHEVAIPLDQVEAWLFDLDGTLMDTDDEAVETLARRLRVLGSCRASALARRIVMAAETPGNTMMTLLDTVGLDAWAFSLRQRLSHRTRATFRLIPGVDALIAHLALRLPLAVVTTRSQADATAFLTQHGLSGYFACCVTCETTKRLKPHPEPIQYAANCLGVKPEACVMVGDTTPDIRAARNAGAWAVGVLCGFGKEDELWRAGAHLVLPSTADLLDLVAKYADPLP